MRNFVVISCLAIQIVVLVTIIHIVFYFVYDVPKNHLLYSKLCANGKYFTLPLMIV